MSKWNFQKPDETDPGEHVFALVVFTQSKEISVRALERAEVRTSFGRHVFAWQPIDYPKFDIEDMTTVLREYNAIPPANGINLAPAWQGPH